MSNSAHIRMVGTAFAALLTFGACGGAEDTPAMVPNVEPTDVLERSPRFPSTEELRLCDRRVPAPPC